MEKLNDVLKDLIIEKVLSLRTIAKESGVSCNQYSKYLRQSIPSINVAMKICNYFECSLDYLCGLTLNKTKSNYTNFDVNKFIENYEKLLSKNHISHYKFAKEMNISESCLRHWKYGQSPTLNIVCKIAVGLSTTIDNLII